MNNIIIEKAGYILDLNERYGYLETIYLEMINHKNRLVNNPAPNQSKLPGILGLIAPKNPVKSIDLKPVAKSIKNEMNKTKDLILLYEIEKTAFEKETNKAVQYIVDVKYLVLISNNSRSALKQMNLRPLKHFNSIEFSDMINDLISKVQEQKQVQPGNKIKWLISVQALGVLLKDMALKGYIDYPKNLNGEMLNSDFAKQISYGFDYEGNNLNTLCKALSDTEFSISFKNADKLKSLPHSKTLAHSPNKKNKH